VGAARAAWRAQRARFSARARLPPPGAARTWMASSERKRAVCLSAQRPEPVSSTFFLFSGSSDSTSHALHKRRGAAAKGGGKGGGGKGGGGGGAGRGRKSARQAGSRARARGLRARARSRDPRRRHARRALLAGLDRRKLRLDLIHGNVHGGLRRGRAAEKEAGGGGASAKSRTSRETARETRQGAQARNRAEDAERAPPGNAEWTSGRAGEWRTNAQDEAQGLRSKNAALIAAGKDEST
jgi:hypothetical protein